MTVPHPPCRCLWCNLANPLYVSYHDSEWGVPLHDDRRLFELLLLESFQAGLSWECVLNKREAFRAAFDGFDFHSIATYDSAKLESLAANHSIIRNRLKIKAAVTNAQAFIGIRREFGSFDSYIWDFTGGHVIRETGPVSSPLSDRVSTDLRRRGMRFVGTVIVYSFLQAAGIINAHEEGCYLAPRPDGEAK